MLMKFVLFAFALCIDDVFVEDFTNAHSDTLMLVLLHTACINIVVRY